MTMRDTPPFRADHVGSLLRPPALLRARDDYAAGRDRRRRAARGRGRRDPRRRAHAGGGRASVGHRRRVPPRLLAHGLHLPARRHHEGRPGTSRSRSTTRTATIEFTPAALHVDGKLGVSTHDLRRRLRASCSETVDDERPEADDPVAEHGPLPRRPRPAIDPAVYPDLDAFWADLTAAYARGGAPARRARLHVPAARRHEPRVPQRPAPARAHRARSAATPSTSTSRTSATSTRRSPAGRTA